jgi:hypothetical protein
MHLQLHRTYILNMVAAGFSETLENTYKIIWRYIPENYS